MEEELLLKFIDVVIQKSGLELEAEFLENYRELLLGELEKSLWLMMVEELSPEALKKFMQLSEGAEDINDLDEDRKKELIQFFENNIENFEEKVLKTMDEFGNNFVEDVKDLKDE
ncbi:MAG: hypothetical protein V1770_05830 [bacterium]